MAEITLTGDRIYSASRPGDSSIIRLLGPDGDHICKAWEQGTYYELALLEAIRARNLGGVYLDVGAHIGNHSIYFGQHCRASHVVAFEPNPDSHRYLACNLAGRGYTPIHCAIHDSWDRVEVEPGPLGNSGMSTIVRADINSLSINAFRLDWDGWEWRRLGRVAVIKIDVEGFEGAVLRSGAQLLEEHRPLLAIECQTAEALDECVRLLAPLGYAVGQRYCATPTYLFEAL